MAIEQQGITLILAIVLGIVSIVLYPLAIKLRRNPGIFIFYIVAAASLTFVSGAIFMSIYGLFRFVDVWPIISISGMACSLSIGIKAIVDVIENV